MSERNPNNPYGEDAPSSSERNPWAPLESYDSTADQGVNPFAPRKLGADLSKSVYEKYYNESAMRGGHNYSNKPVANMETPTTFAEELKAGREEMKILGEKYFGLESFASQYIDAANVIEGRMAAVQESSVSATNPDWWRDNADSNPLVPKTPDREVSQEKRRPGFLRKIGSKVLEAVRNMQASRDNERVPSAPQSLSEQDKDHWTKAA